MGNDGGGGGVDDVNEMLKIVLIFFAGIALLFLIR